MAEEKDASMDLKSELAELEGLEGNLGDTTDVSADLVEMKNRMDKSDQEMRAMTEAMKSTLLDVRTLMQDMDNPFNMLRDMGVDKLVTKAVETVEEEVNAKKNEDAKNKMAGSEEEGGSQSPIVAKIEGSTTSHPGVISTRPAPVAAAPPAAPAQPVQVPVATPGPVAPSVATPAVAAGGVAPVQAAPVHTNGEQATQLLVKPEAVSETVEPAVVAQTVPAPTTVPTAAPTAVPAAQSAVATPVAAPQVTEAPVVYTHIEERLYQTEETINSLAGTVNELVKTIRVQREQPARRKVYSTPSSPESTDFYEAYVGLVSDYMYIRLGDRGAEELLLEGMYKEWASPKVVRDIMDKLSGKKRRRGKAVDAEANVEDRMLITTLLRNLDKPTREWNESTQLFMLMALVSRAKENTA